MDERAPSPIPGWFGLRPGILRGPGGRPCARASPPTARGTGPDRGTPPGWCTCSVRSWPEEEQAADDGDSKRAAQLGPGTPSQRERQTAQHRGHGGHGDGPKTKHTRLEDCVPRMQAFPAFRLNREVDHHDRVLLDDSHQQDDPYKGDHVQFVVRDQQRKQRAYACRRKRGENGERMDQALIQHSQNDVHHDNGGGDENRLTGERLLIGLRSSLKAAVNIGRQPDLALRPGRSPPLSLRSGRRLLAY